MLSQHGITIAPGTFYRWLNQPLTAAQVEEAYLVNAIVTLYRRNRSVYGVWLWTSVTSLSFFPCKPRVD